jgi:DNA-binding transcriptional LysR family regulator
MDLKRLRAFITVTEEGSVSKAALRLHTAQPALSRQIIDLERELGLKLFDRVGRRLHRLEAYGADPRRRPWAIGSVFDGE